MDQTTLAQVIESLFAQSEELPPPTLDTTGYDPATVKWSDVRRTKKGFILRRTIQGIDKEVGEIRSDIISYNPNTGESSVLASDSIYLPKKMRDIFGDSGTRETETFGYETLTHALVLEERLLAGISVQLPHDIKQWPSLEEYNSWCLAPQVPKRASLVLYDLETGRKKTIDLTEEIIQFIKEDGYHRIGHLILNVEQREKAADFLKGHVTASRSMGARNPLQDMIKTPLKSLPAIAVRDVVSMQYDTEQRKVSVAIQNGSCHESQDIRLNIALGTAYCPNGYTTQLETSDPNQHFEKNAIQPECTVYALKRCSAFHLVHEDKPSAQRIKLDMIGALACVNAPFARVNEYPDKYNLQQRIELISVGVDAESTRRYNETNIERVDYIIRFHQHGVEPRIAQQLTERFGLYATDIPKKFSPEVALTYDKRFDGYDLAHGFPSTITPDVANSYASKGITTAGTVSELVKNGITAEVASKYVNVPLEKIVIFVKEQIPEVLASPYCSEATITFLTTQTRNNLGVNERGCRKSGGEAVSDDKIEGQVTQNILKYCKADIPSERTVKYDPRFTPDEIILLINANITDTVANRAYGIVPVHQIIEAKENLEGVVEYSEVQRPFGRWVKSELGDSEHVYVQQRLVSVEEARVLKDAGITASLLSTFHSDLGISDVIKLVQSGINPGPLSNDPRDKIALNDYVRSFEQPVSSYHPALSGADIERLLKVQIYVGQDNALVERFGAEGIVKLAEAEIGIVLDKGEKPWIKKKVYAGAYDTRYSAANILELVQTGTTPDIANCYCTHIPGDKVVELVQAGVSYTDANQQGVELNVEKSHMTTEPKQDSTTQPNWLKRWFSRLSRHSVKEDVSPPKNTDTENLWEQ